MECAVNEIVTDLGCIPDTPAGFVLKFYKLAVGMIGGVGFLGVLYAGYMLLTAAGNPVQIDKGRRFLTASVTGVLLVVFAMFYYRQIAVNILGVPGFK